VVTDLQDRVEGIEAILSGRLRAVDAAEDGRGFRCSDEATAW
jgi:hypothetical protein